MPKVSDKRHFLMKAHTYEPDDEDFDPTGFFMSEKLDGHRCFWDGGISQGFRAKDIPFANTAKDKKDHWATGLWSSGGKVVHAPKSWLAGLPNGQTLDGELYLGRGQLEALAHIVRSEDATEDEWDTVKLHVFDQPGLQEFLQDGRIHDGDWETTFKDLRTQLKEIFGDTELPGTLETQMSKSFRDVLVDLEKLHKQQMRGKCSWLLHKQEVVKDKKQVERELERVAKFGGEGLVLRGPDSRWIPIRSHDNLKYKKFYDSEAEVIGYTFGKKTDKGGKLMGMLGTLTLKTLGDTKIEKGLVFEMGGGLAWTGDVNLRELEWVPGSKPPLGISGGVNAYAFNAPGEVAPEFVQAKHFPRGTVITFKWWDLTKKTGCPKFAQYWRKREDI